MTGKAFFRPAIFAAALACAGLPAWGQANSRAVEVRLANGNILRLLAVFESSPAAQHANIRSQAATVLAARAASLEALIREQPAQALALAFAPDALARLAQAFPDSARFLEIRGTWSGTADYLIFDDLNLATARSRIRLKGAQGWYEVHFAGREPEGLKSGAQLRVNGVAANAEIAALDGSVQTATTAAASSCTPLGNQNIAVLLVTFPGVAAPAIAPQTIYDQMFGSTGRSLNNYWREVSYGKTSATGDVFGWYTLDQLYTCDRYYEMLSAAIRAADPYVNFQNYTRVFVIFPNPGGCSWAGLSNVGCGSYSSPGDGSFIASSSWMLATYFTSTDQAVKLTTHEAGHALGLMHSRSRDFGAEALGALGTGGTLSEYGDLFSSMGSWNLGHYAAQQKVSLGWLPSANVNSVQSPGSFAVLPAENTASGTQALKILRGTGNNAWLWVEYRQPAGNYDTTLASQVFGGALVHYYDSVTGSRTDLLDFTAATSSFTDPALPSGATWTDPYTNVSLSVTGATSGALNLAVNYGPVPCVAAPTALSLSPANPSAEAGKPVSYTLTLTNNDSAGCSASSFSLASSQPLGWTSTLSPSVLTVSPGQSGTATLTKTIPSGTAPGTVAVDASATGPQGTVTASANLTVLPPPPALSVSLAASATSYTTKTPAVLTAMVLSGTAPASGAVVKFTVKAPNGATTVKNVTADANGRASYTYRFGPKDPKGTYSATAQATYRTQTASSAAVSFALR